MKDSPAGERFQDLANRISETRSPSCAPAGSIRKPRRNCARRISNTSHEALLLGYEQALTRVDSTSGDPYATSGHFLWIGDRTRQPDHAHVEYFRASRTRSGSNAAPRSRRMV